jgi:hypothetical protein
LWRAGECFKGIPSQYLKRTSHIPWGHRCVIQLLIEFEAVGSRIAISATAARKGLKSQP